MTKGPLWAGLRGGWNLLRLPARGLRLVLVLLMVVVPGTINLGIMTVMFLLGAARLRSRQHKQRPQ